MRELRLRGVRCEGNRKHSVASSAVPSAASRRPPHQLKHRLALLLKAVCTQPMRWFGSLHAWLQTVNKRSRIWFVKHVALSLNSPVFALHQFFFKLAYASGQRELIRLGRETKRLGGHDLSPQFTDLGIERVQFLSGELRRGGCTAAELEEAIDRVRRRLEAGGERNYGDNIGHETDSTAQGEPK